MKIKSGFTLVELLLGISILGILSGITLGIINPERQRNIAKDSVNKSTLLKLAESIEAYKLASDSSSYPLDIFAGGTSLAMVQIKSSDTAANTVYKVGGIPPSWDTSKFCLCIPSLVNTSKYFWYKSSTTKIEELTESCNVECL